MDACADTPHITQIAVLNARDTGADAKPCAEFFEAGKPFLKRALAIVQRENFDLALNDLYSLLYPIKHIVNLPASISTRKGREIVTPARPAAVNHLDFHTHA